MVDAICNKTEWPEYRPRCLRDLYNLLGFSDASVEWIEVAVRHLEHEYTFGGNPRMYMLAEEYKVRVNPIDLKRVSVRWSSLQILSVYQFAEWFLDQFRREHPRNIREKKDGEDLLSYTLDAFNIRKVDFGQLEYDVLDYYRRVRNHLLHTAIEPQKKTDITQLENIQQLIKESQYSKLLAPNRIESLCFDDFILFSRVLKHAACTICTLACPTTEEFFLLIQKEYKLLQVLNAEKDSECRLKAKLTSFLHMNFGLKNTADKICVKLLEEMRLLAQR